MSENMVREEGTLTRDPEVKALPSGVTLLKFSIAQNTRKKNEAGEWVDGEAMFFDVDFFPNDPQYWLKRLAKGVTVIVVGTLKQDRWEKDGQVHSKVSIRAETIYAKWIPEITATNSASSNDTATGNNLPVNPPF
jgi:single-strand DNA-binding protein